MRALDSNIILRLLLNDDQQQAASAAAVIREPCWIGLTVLLEVAWVLGSLYRFERHQIATLLRGLGEYETLVIEGGPAVAWCLDRYETGGDIADLLHLAAARDRTAFATFDRGIAKAAGSDPPVPVETLA